MQVARLSLRNTGRADRKALSRHTLCFGLVTCFFLFGCLFVHAELPMKVYRHHANEENKIALTFDDGPHPRYTYEILEILEEFDVPATFFFLGENIEYYSEAAAEVAKHGHEIGNHTYTHPRTSELDAETLRRELTQCEDIIQRRTDTCPKLFRPPMGSWNKTVYELARERDYSVILWDLDTMDWAHASEEKIASYVSENIKSGDIILMHDYHTGGCTTTGALRLFLPELIERGFRFVTVSELIGSR